MKIDLPNVFHAIDFFLPKLYCVGYKRNSLYWVGNGLLYLVFRMLAFYQILSDCSLWSVLQFFLPKIQYQVDLKWSKITPSVSKMCLMAF